MTQILAQVNDDIQYFKRNVFLHQWISNYFQLLYIGVMPSYLEFRASYSSRNFSQITSWDFEKRRNIPTFRLKYKIHRFIQSVEHGLQIIYEWILFVSVIPISNMSQELHKRVWSKLHAMRIANSFYAFLWLDIIINITVACLIAKSLWRLDTKMDLLGLVVWQHAPDSILSTDASEAETGKFQD